MRCLGKAACRDRQQSTVLPKNTVQMSNYSVYTGIAMACCMVNSQSGHFVRELFAGPRKGKSGEVNHDRTMIGLSKAAEESATDRYNCNTKRHSYSQQSTSTIALASIAPGSTLWLATAVILSSHAFQAQRSSYLVRTPSTQLCPIQKFIKIVPANSCCCCRYYCCYCAPQPFTFTPVAS